MTDTIFPTFKFPDGAILSYDPVRHRLVKINTDGSSIPVLLKSAKGHSPSDFLDWIRKSFPAIAERFEPFIKQCYAANRRHHFKRLKKQPYVYHSTPLTIQ